MLNIMLALIFIKVIDFVYFIAQEQDFQDRATEFLIVVARVLAWILGAAFTIFVIIAGFRMIFGGGKSESLNGLKNIITGIFLGSLVIFMFLLIIYQVIQEFGV